MKKINNKEFEGRSTNKNIELRYLLNPKEIIIRNNKSVLQLSRTNLIGESHHQKAIDSNNIVEEIEFDLLIKVEKEIY